MIRFSITPAFWLVSVILGYMSSGNLKGTVLWVFVILVSVLVHELGHALCALSFGLRSTVTLVAFGGITSYASQGVSKFKQFLIILCGPVFGAVLFFFSYLGWQYFAFDRPLIASIFYVMQWVNLVWTSINLLPILPLDGGQILLLIFEAIFKAKGQSYALFTSILLAVLLSVLFVLFSYYLVGFLFVFLALQSYARWKRS
jgi:stage IV sporulation protein FB